MNYRRLTTIVLLALTLGTSGAVAAQWETHPDRSLSNDDAFYGGRFQAWEDFTQGAISTYVQQVDVDDLSADMTDEGWVLGTGNLLSLLRSTYVVIDDSQWEIEGDPEEIQESTSAIYKDIDSAATTCQEAIGSRDADAYADCDGPLREALSDWQDLSDSVHDWILGNGFSFNRD